MLLFMFCRYSLQPAVEHFESTAYIFIINALIPSSIAIFFFTMLYDLYGISIDKTVLNALKYTSPIGGLFYIGEFAEDASSSVSNTMAFLHGLVFMH